LRIAEVNTAYATTFFSTLSQSRPPLEAIVVERSPGVAHHIHAAPASQQCGSAGGLSLRTRGSSTCCICTASGEVPISIMSDPEERDGIGHTIRALGRVTQGLAALQAGRQSGSARTVRPRLAAAGNERMRCRAGDRRARLRARGVGHSLRAASGANAIGKLVIIQGVKHAEDLIWREQYDRWAKLPDTQVLVAASEGAAFWPWHVGRVTELFGLAQLRSGCAPWR
ncbi:MAG: hypothetical protein MZW92_15645, partial [Comamonadaceae bacterium]|nr:hypothetical protein [Comamonadaceae bacterium]